MLKNDLLELTLQLDNELKELICITDNYILVKWLQDRSYVSWRYHYNDEVSQYVFEYGKYMPTEHTTIEEAIASFSERINDD